MEKVSRLTRKRQLCLTLIEEHLLTVTVSPGSIVLWQVGHSSSDCIRVFLLPVAYLLPPSHVSSRSSQ